MEKKKGRIEAISIVIPVFNESDNILPLINEIDEVLKRVINFEILVIDDGSTDSTYSKTINRSKNLKALRVFRHDKNYGQSISIRTGILKAKEDYIITLDGDGQNNPMDIIKLLNYYDKSKGFLLVIGNRIKRNDSKFRIIASRLAFFIRQTILKDKTPDNGCAIKLFKKKDFLLLPFFNHIHRFLPVFFKVCGGQVISVPVDHRKRVSGYSKYSNFQRAIVGFYDLFGVLWLRKRTFLPILKNVKTKKIKIK